MLLPDIDLSEVDDNNNFKKSCATPVIHSRSIIGLVYIHVVTIPAIRPTFVFEYFISDLK